MPRQTFVYRDGKWVDITAAIDANRGKPRKTPYIRADTMTPIQSMVDGQMYDSKSAYYSHLRATGHHIVEEKPQVKEFDAKGIVTAEHIKEAIDYLEAGNPAPDPREPILTWED